MTLFDIKITIELLFLLTLTLLHDTIAFTPIASSNSADPCKQLISSRNFRLKAVADPPMLPAEQQGDKKKKREPGDDSDEIGNEWTRVNGGFLPSFQKKAAKRQKVAVTQIKNIDDYKTFVGEERNAIVVVRFFASWCRSCRASEPFFKRVVSRYFDSQKPGMQVKFAEVPLGKETIHLHEGLGVPSVPFVHIYHPDGGLVEEMKFTKKHYTKFTEILETYRSGSCIIPPDEEGEVLGVFE